MDAYTAANVVDVYHKEHQSHPMPWAIPSFCLSVQCNIMFVLVISYCYYCIVYDIFVYGKRDICISMHWC
jgi:hypothetical protein